MVALPCILNVLKSHELHETVGMLIPSHVVAVSFTALRYDMLTLLRILAKVHASNMSYIESYGKWLENNGIVKSVFEFVIKIIEQVTRMVIGLKPAPVRL